MVVHVYSGITSRFYTIADAIELVNSRHGQGKKELIILWPIVDDCRIDIKDVLEKIDTKDIEVTFVSFRTSKKDLMEINIRKSFWKSIAAFLYDIYAVCYNAIFDNAGKMIKKYATGKDMIDFNPPMGVGWAGEAYEDYTYRTWKMVEERVQKDTDLYIHAYGGIIYEKQTVHKLRPLIFKDTYWDTVEEILGKYEREQLVGVHIRRTDHDTCIQMSPLYLFTKKMDELVSTNPEVRFFLATDDEETQKKLIESYGSRIIIQHKTWGRDSKDGMRCGIIDCLCLSRCSIVLGSYTSGFSHFSAEYGGIELVEMRVEEKESTSRGEQ